jgi:hypothetical protein
MAGVRSERSWLRCSAVGAGSFCRSPGGGASVRPGWSSSCGSPSGGSGCWSSSQVWVYLKTLEEKYEMVEKRLPVFAKLKARKGHDTIRDNFPRSWLDALAVPTAAINFRPLQTLVEQVD